ncbi:hypothetical protein Ahia01_000791100 [Argonauta hians]
MSREKEENAGLVSRLRLNDNKAGMQNLDREKINQIIYEASKGSKYFENEKKKDRQVDLKIGEQQQKIARFTQKEIMVAEKEADTLLQKLESERDLSRTIVHIDMDAFYAAVETRDNPSLLNIPMAVGSNSMLSTSNYIARRYGVRAAMPGFIAKKLCPQLVIVPSNFPQYAAVSQQVKDILVKYDKHFCQIGFDEAYLDITEHLKLRKALPKEKRTVKCRTCDRLDPRYCYCDPNKSWFEFSENEDFELLCGGSETPSSSRDPVCLLGQDKADVLRIPDPSSEQGAEVQMCPSCQREIPGYRPEVFGVSAQEAVREMRQRIEQRTRLTASAGIAANTLLAKICSDKNKPNGQFNLPHITDVIKDFITDLPIRKVSGIGKVTEKMLQAIDVVTCSQLYQQRALLHLLYSDTSFNHFMAVALGIGSTHVESDGEKKSVSTEQTFFEINEPAQLYEKCEELSKILASDLQQDSLMGRTVTLKIKTVDFDVKTRAQSVSRHTCDEVQICNVARNILKTEIQNCLPKPLRLRLMGVRMSNLIPSSHFSKKETIEYFMKKNSSTNDSNVSTDVERNNVNKSHNHQSKNAGISDENLEKGISESPGHFCPICNRKCPKNLRLFNAHIDKCLLQQSGENDRKSRRTSPVITKADFEDFYEVSTPKPLKKTKQKIKMTQKNLKTVFEETLVGNETWLNSSVEKFKCDSDNLFKTENIPKTKQDSTTTNIMSSEMEPEIRDRATTTNIMSSEMEPEIRDRAILETCVDPMMLTDNSSCGSITNETGKESSSLESKQHTSSSSSSSSSSPVNKPSNTTGHLSDDLDQCPPEEDLADNSTRFPEVKGTELKPTSPEIHCIKEPDRIGPMKNYHEDVENSQSKNLLQQAGCEKIDSETNSSSMECANSIAVKSSQSNKNMLRQAGCDKDFETISSSVEGGNSITVKPSRSNKTVSNTQTKLNNSLSTRNSKKSYRNCNLLQYFSKSCVNNEKRGDQSRLEWSKPSESAVIKTEISDEEIEANIDLLSKHSSDPLQKVIDTGQISSTVSGRPLIDQWSLDSQKKTLISDKIQKGNCLDNESRQKYLDTSHIVFQDSNVGTGQFDGQLYNDCDKITSVNTDTGRDYGKKIGIDTDNVVSESGQIATVGSEFSEIASVTTDTDSGDVITVDTSKDNMASESGKIASDNEDGMTDSGSDYDQMTSIDTDRDSDYDKTTSIDTDIDSDSGKMTSKNRDGVTGSGREICVNNIETNNETDSGWSSNNTEHSTKVINSVSMSHVERSVETDLSVSSSDVEKSDETVPNVTSGHIEKSVGTDTSVVSGHIEEAVETDASVTRERSVETDESVPSSLIERSVGTDTINYYLSHSTINLPESSDPAIEVISCCDNTNSLNGNTTCSYSGQCDETISKPDAMVSIEPECYTESEASSTNPNDTHLPDNEVIVEASSSEQTVTTELVHCCPICNDNIHVEDMSTFNEHVDLCLNQTTIRKILLEQGEQLKNSATFKRPAEAPSPDTSKRKKSLKSNSTPRIDSYFFNV